MTEAFEIVKKKLAGSKYNVSKLAPEQTLSQDYGMKGENIIELAMDIEDHFKVEITEEEIATWNTVGDVTKTVNRFLNNGNISMETDIVS